LIAGRQEFYPEGSLQRTTPEAIPAFSVHVREAAKEVSEKLGYKPNQPDQGKRNNRPLLSQSKAFGVGQPDKSIRRRYENSQGISR
jgi:DNA-binding LacI/PurR family transcriptional regulator